jgi:hypothetical protein
MATKKLKKLPNLWLRSNKLKMMKKGVALTWKVKTSYTLA